MSVELSFINEVGQNGYLGKNSNIELSINFVSH